MTTKSLNYAKAGVNIDAGNELVSRLKSITKKTHRPGVLGGIGGFGALFEIPLANYRNPILVSTTDGVGTKLKLATELNKHETIGIDLVAMCVNDIIVSGAEPLYFLDYFATGKLDPEQATIIIQGIAEGCLQANCALVGGETAEMPGMYHNNDYDLAGFCVGIVEKSKLIDGSRIQAGNKLIAIAASGPHSNGYSLIRKILELKKVNLQQPFKDSTLGEMLLKPTKIYVNSILKLKQQIDILGIAHITGGGITENLPRILPSSVQACIQTFSYKIPEIFHWLQQEGEIESSELWRTFNCGVGMIVCVAENQVNLALEQLTALGETAWEIGHITARKENHPNIIYAS